MTAGDKKWRFERYLEQIMSKEHTCTRKAKQLTHTNGQDILPDGDSGERDRDLERMRKKGKCSEITNKLRIEHRVELATITVKSVHRSESFCAREK